MRDHTGRAAYVILHLKIEDRVLPQIPRTIPEVVLTRCYVAASMRIRSSKPSSMPITQAQLAEKLGLSQRTVSVAFSGSGRINEQTRLRVLEAARKHGYRPNRLAMGLRGGRTGSVGLIWSFADPWTGDSIIAVDLLQRLQARDLGRLPGPVRRVRRRPLPTDRRHAPAAGRRHPPVGHPPPAASPEGAGPAGLGAGRRRRLPGARRGLLRRPVRPRPVGRHRAGRRPLRRRRAEAPLLHDQHPSRSPTRRRSRRSWPAASAAASSRTSTSS